MLTARVLATVIIIAGLSSARGLAQHAVNYRTTYERLYAVVPLIGAGTLEDPIRPKYAPAPAAEALANRAGIVGYQFIKAVDGVALVEFVGTSRAAFAALLQDHSIAVFLRGRDSLEAMHAEFRRHKKDFDFAHFGVLMP